jgi:hypothetical protein
MQLLIAASLQSRPEPETDFGQHCTDVGFFESFLDSMLTNDTNRSGNLEITQPGQY